MFIQKHYPYILEDYAFDSIEINNDGLIDLGFITINSNIKINL